MRFKGTNECFLIQAVGPVFSEIERLETNDNSTPETSVVLIFKDLNGAEIKNSFSQYVLNN